MGNFYGHLAPGIFFIIYGVLWTILTWRLYFKSVIERGESFRSELSPPVKIKGKNINIEAIMAVVFTVVGMLVEFRHVYMGGEIGITRTQHGTMYIFFLAFAVLKLLNPRSKQFLPNVEDIEYVLLVMALAAEALLFDFHLMERDVLDTTIHILLVYSICGGIVMCLAEMFFRNQVLFALGRAFFALLQGNWFCQVAFILYSPIPDKSGVYNTRWDHKNPEHTMFATCLYTSHIGGAFLFSFLCGLCFAFVYNKKGSIQHHQLNLEPRVNGEVQLVNKEEDVESNSIVDS